MIARTAVADEAREAADLDVALLDRMRNNEAEAFEIFVRRHTGRLLATARRFLRSEPDCADAVQKSFISAFGALHQFEGSSQVATWLHRIVVNVCLMTLRSAARSKEVSLDSLLPQFDATGHHASGVRPWCRPDERISREETQSLVRRCIDQLPEDYRAILLLRDIEELSTEDTAAHFEITTGAVKTRLHRARQALRTLLEPHFAS